GKMKSSLLKAKTTSELSTPTKPERPRNVKAKEHYKSYRKKKIKSGRKCKICGNDPYPNYFFCPACHHRIGVYEENE
ncbi:MAG: hypothetical protein WBC36_05480, partial [Desulfobacterales bacterium]